MWTDADGGKCVRAEEKVRFSAFHCDDDADCLEGDSCWLDQVGSSCCRGEACFGHAVHSRWVACRTVADCPKLGPEITFACKPDKDLPPSIEKRCFQL